MRTPLLESSALNERLGCRLLVKAECLQRTGSFKFRGAYNNISRLDENQRRAGVVAFSSGNHAQGVAAAAAMTGAPATIFMPKDAPETKIAGTKALGAQIRYYDRNTDDREALATAFAGETGATMIKPFDAFHTIAGQGTVGLEVAEQSRELDVDPDLVLVPCSGGGLISGIALALAELLPKAGVHPVEPQESDDWRRSLASGKRTRVDVTPGSLCDALLLPQPGELTFNLAAPLLGPGLTVGNDDVLAAMATAFQHLKIVLEPGGAAALAAVLSGKIEVSGRSVVAVASGGNVDGALFARAISGNDKT